MKLSMKVFLACCTALAALALFWFLSSAPPVQSESPVRMLIGGIVLFLLPGLVWGEVLGFRSEHVLETIALSFAITLAAGVLLVPVPFLLHASIRLWVWLLLLLGIAGIGLLAYRSRSGGEAAFLGPILKYREQPKQQLISTSLLLAIIALVTVALYRWGEAILDIDGEKLLHFTYVRYYASLPLSLSISILKDAPLPNLVSYWEFLLAGWSTLVHVDPLPLAYHGRVLIPVFGFSAVFLLIRYIFIDRTRSEAVFWGVLLMCLGWFGLVSPSHLEWVRADPFRGLFSFMGTVHHADSAMEILMPLNVALILFAFRDKGWRGALLLAGSLSASFLWHTREFFQAVVYFGVLGLTFLLLPKEERGRSMRTWLRVLAVFAVVIVVFSVLLALLVPARSFGYNDLQLKKFAFIDAVASMTDIRSPFHFPVEIRMTQGLDVHSLVSSMDLLNTLRANWGFYLWVILSALAAPVLALWGGREGRRLVLFYLLLWLLTLCWGFSQFMLIVLTYSEILFTLPRMIYLFSYIVGAAGLVVLFERFTPEYQKPRSFLFAAVGILACGLLLRVWWNFGVPGGQEISWVFGWVFLVTILGIVVFPSPADAGQRSARLAPIVLAMLLFLVPFLAKDYRDVGLKLFTSSRPSVPWFGEGNPLGLSPQMIQFARSLPPGRTYVTDPFGPDVMSLYAPLYPAVPPEVMGRTIIDFIHYYRQAAQGGAPLFQQRFADAAQKGIPLPKDAVDDAAVREMLARTAADYIFIENRYYAALLPYFAGHPDAYALLYNNPTRSELIVGVTRRPGT